MCHILVNDIDNGSLLTVYDTDTGLSAGAGDGDQLGDVLDSCPPETEPSLMMTLRKSLAYFVRIL